MRAIALHPDVLVVKSAVLQANCVIVRGLASSGATSSGETPIEVLTVRGDSEAGETFVIDSPVLPEELDALPAVLEQARFPAASGLLATHGDWDHLLGRLAFPDLALACAESTEQRLGSRIGEAQRELRAFDEDLMIERRLPLSLSAVQALPVPGHCELGDREIELHPADGHTIDGMAVAIPWAAVLVLGDYLSAIELPVLGAEADIVCYIATLERFRALIAISEHIVPGHGPILSRERALSLLDEDLAYLRALSVRGADVELPAGRRGTAQRRLHAANASSLRDRDSPSHASSQRQRHEA